MKITIKIKLAPQSPVNGVYSTQAIVYYPPTQTKSVFDWLPDWATQDVDLNEATQVSRSAGRK